MKNRGQNTDAVVVDYGSAHDIDPLLFKQQQSWLQRILVPLVSLILHLRPVVVNLVMPDVLHLRKPSFLILWAQLVGYYGGWWEIPMILNELEHFLRNISALTYWMDVRVFQRKFHPSVFEHGKCELSVAVEGRSWVRVPELHPSALHFSILTLLFDILTAVIAKRCPSCDEMLRLWLSGPINTRSFYITNDTWHLSHNVWPITKHREKSAHFTNLQPMTFKTNYLLQFIKSINQSPIIDLQQMDFRQ